MNKKALWIRVCIEDWPAKKANIASNYESKPWVDVDYIPFPFEGILKVCSHGRQQQWLGFHGYCGFTRECFATVAVILCEWTLNTLTLNLRLSTVIREFDIKKTAAKLRTNKLATFRYITAGINVLLYLAVYPGCGFYLPIFRWDYQTWWSNS